VFEIVTARLNKTDVDGGKEAEGLRGIDSLPVGQGESSCSEIRSRNLELIGFGLRLLLGFIEAPLSFSIYQPEIDAPRNRAARVDASRDLRTLRCSGRTVALLCVETG